MDTFKALHVIPVISTSAHMCVISPSHYMYTSSLSLWEVQGLVAVRHLSKRRPLFKMVFQYL